jgi:hypothetical protein
MTDNILIYFAHAHLPESLRRVSEPFGQLAHSLVDTLPPSAERSTALRKLLEGKDAAVRAALPAGRAYLPRPPDPAIEEARIHVANLLGLVDLLASAAGGPLAPAQAVTREVTANANDWMAKTEPPVSIVQEEEKAS